MIARGVVTVLLLILSIFSIKGVGIFFILSRLQVIGNGVFSNFTSYVQFEYITPITPIGWLDNMWNVIFAWMAAFLIYGLTTIFRRIPHCEGTTLIYDERPSYLYKQPRGGVIPPMVYLSIIVLAWMSVTYLFLWDKFYFLSCAVLTLSSALLAHFAYYLMAYHTFSCQNVLFDCSKTHDVWILRILGVNGLALFASWLTYLGLLNMSVAIVYQGVDRSALVNPEIAGRICGGIYLAWILLSILADMFILEKFTRYSVLHYFCAMMCGCGIVLLRPSVYGDFPLNTLIGCAIVGFGTFAFVVKLIFGIVRHHTKSYRYQGKQFHPRVIRKLT